MYDGAQYDLSHLKPFSFKVRSKEDDLAVSARFSYHCCSDKRGVSRGLGSRMKDDLWPEEERYFFPVRWFLSLRLAGLLAGLGSRRLMRAHGYQRVHIGKADGISLDWAVWLKVLPGAPNAIPMIAVESSYLAQSPPRKGRLENFAFIVVQTRRTGRLYGEPPSAVGDRKT
jgi:hypothetical protein